MENMKVHKDNSEKRRCKRRKVNTEYHLYLTDQQGKFIIKGKLVNSGNFGILLECGSSLTTLLMLKEYELSIININGRILKDIKCRIKRLVECERDKKYQLGIEFSRKIDISFVWYIKNNWARAC